MIEYNSRAMSRRVEINIDPDEALRAEGAGEGETH